MGIQHLFGNEPHADWRQGVTKSIQILYTDVQRIWRRLGQTPDPVGAPPAGIDPWNPVDGTSGGNGAIYEGFLAGTLAGSASDGSSPGTATLNLWAVVSGTWQATGDTVTVTNRSNHLWLPPGTHLLRCVKINGEIRPVIQFSPPYRATLTSTLSSSSATANLLYNSSGSWTAYSPNISITVNAGLNIGSNTIASGKGVFVQFVGGNFWVFGADCPS